MQTNHVEKATEQWVIMITYIRQAHKCIDNPANGTNMSTDDTAATVIVSTSTDIAALHNNQAKAT